MNKDNLTTILMALIVGGVIGHHIDDIVEKNYPPLISSINHPLQKEYHILKGCIDSDTRVISETNYLKKEKICICTLQKLESTTPRYYTLEENYLLDKFEENLKVCTSEIN